MSENKYLSLNGLRQYDDLIKEEIAKGDSNSINSSKSYAESYVSSEINKLVDGTTTVAKAMFATESDYATKATQDVNGREISSTYETKTDASVKIDNHNTSSSAHEDIREKIDEIEKQKEIYVGEDIPTDQFVRLWIDPSDSFLSDSLPNFEEVYF